MPRVNATDLLLEFEKSPALIDGERYVLVRRACPPEDHLTVFDASPTYIAQVDSWRFPDGSSQKRTDRDLWIPAADYPTALDRAHEQMEIRVFGTLKA